MNNINGCNNRISTFEFSKKEIDEAAQNNKLLTMEMEFSLKCNFRCQYCYVDQNLLNNELTKEEICDVILQAEELGARKIIILGGEPMMYPYTMEIISFMRKRSIKVEMFTNGSYITAEIARQLFEQGVTVTLKMNSFNESIQDMLAGYKGASKIIWDAFHNLKKAGYPSEKSPLVVSTIICKQNMDELLNIWQWLREQNIVPYFETLTPQGHATQNKWLDIDIRKVHDIFHEISKIDREHYGNVWKPQPPLVASRCLRHKYSCLIDPQGYVMPCVGVRIPVGNIRKRKLSEIIKDNEVISRLRNYEKNIKGPCRNCEKIEGCYGCRGAAYHLTGDYLASDPLCWKNINRQEDIQVLPIAVDALIPQQSPMRVIDTLDSMGERTANAAVKVSADMPFVGEGGTVDEVIYIEFIAQATAALNGFMQLGISGKKTEGFLLGAKNFDILGKAKVGDTLNVSVYKYGQFDDFGIIKGTVSRGDELLARGEIKIWHNTLERKQGAEAAKSSEQKKAFSV